MKKLIRGIVEFRRTLRPNYRDTFARLALGQSPDALLIACSDSRVVPNLFASADPGDLFVVRNVGNLMVPASEGSEPDAALEFAVQTLKITDIIVCGHSECGAMQALLKGRNSLELSGLRSWLRHAEAALEALAGGQAPDRSLERHNQLSQLNVLTQLDHLRTYPFVQKRLQEGRLRLHGWWFELRNADVYAYDDVRKRFVLIDDAEAKRLLKDLP